MNAGTLTLVGLLVANAAWTASLVAAPLLLAPGTVTDLDGHANILDHGAHWAALPWFERLVYTYGDLQCHQKASRSWTLGGNQMPVDVRMFSGFLFAIPGLAWALAVPAHAHVRHALPGTLPRAVRDRLGSDAARWTLAGCAWALAFGPALLDVGVQTLTAYVSTNALRFGTGIPLGLLGGLLVGLLVRSFWAPASAESGTSSSPKGGA